MAWIAFVPAWPPTLSPTSHAQLVHMAMKDADRASAANGHACGPACKAPATLPSTKATVSASFRKVP